MPPSKPPAAHVAKQVIAAFGDRLHDKAICLTTPVPTLVPMGKVKMSAALQGLVERYEPRAKKHGLYTHQAEIINSLAGPTVPNIVMTTATGSGKSLGFWAWAFQLLAARSESTVAATFPTQALLWGQAKRLALASDPKSLVEVDDLKGASFAGTITAGGISIPWTVWYGTSQCRFMRKHQESEAFKRARLRLSTVDKVHYSLITSLNRSFLEQLDGVIVDEAHYWHGLAGANVRALMNRIRLSMDVLARAHPALFLASATLANPTSFAEDLTGVSASSFRDVSDRGTAKASLVPTSKLPSLLVAKPEPGLLRRYVSLVKPEPTPGRAEAVLKTDVLGKESTALCFVQSKFVGHRLRQKLESTLKSHDLVAYDGDLSAKDRRKIEHELFDSTSRPKVVIGTNALELGVDLPTLDVVIMDELPARRCELLQRLGRVGRTFERPGLAVLCLGQSPGDERLLEEPLAAVAADDIRAIPLPLHLDIVRLRAVSLAFREWNHLKRTDPGWPRFQRALQRYFNWAPTRDELKAEQQRQLGDLVDLNDGSWYYEGFRVSASQGKRDLVLAGSSKVVAVIDDMSIFRDAHPEGIYLGHEGKSFRVKRYHGDWDVGTWTSPGGVVLGKYMKGLKRIEVTEETRGLATRGRWRDTFTLEERKDPPNDSNPPKVGALTFGTFSFLRKFDGYVELDLRKGGKAKNVSLGEVHGRFKSAIAADKTFPFLHNFSYRTTGWKWMIARVLEEGQRAQLAPVLSPLLQSFLADAVECSNGDIQVAIDPAAGELRVVDATPGGSGLSEALLTQGRVAAGLQTAKKTLRSYQRRGAAALRRYLAEECRADPDTDGKEILDAVARLADAWHR